MQNIIEKAAELNARLSALLNDPQPGLVSWGISLHEVLTDLGKLSGTNKIVCDSNEKITDIGYC